MDTMSELKLNAIRNRAYQIWEENGCPEGQAEDNWLQAEREVTERMQSLVDEPPRQRRRDERVQTATN